MKETARRADERDSRSAELRAQLEADAATLRKAQKAVETERAVQKVHYKSFYQSLRFSQAAFAVLSYPLGTYHWSWSRH